MLPLSSTLPHFWSPCNLNGDIITREQCQDSSMCLCACVRPHLSCSLLQLIYHSVYCVAHSCLFMLRQCKKTAERGAAEDCFCLSSCSILNPASPSNAWWWSRVCGGRGPVQSTTETFFFLSFFFSFPCCSVSAGERQGSWGCNEARLIAEIQDSESREPTAPLPWRSRGTFSPNSV